MYDDIVTAASWADAATAVVAVAAALGIALVARKGARLVLGMFR